MNFTHILQIPVLSAPRLVEVPNTSGCIPALLSSICTLHWQAKLNGRFNYAHTPPTPHHPHIIRT